MSTFKKKFTQILFPFIVCLLLFSSNFIFDANTTIAHASTTYQVSFPISYIGSTNPSVTKSYSFDQSVLTSATVKADGLSFSNIKLPFNLVDISLFFAVLAIILVPTSKLIPRYYQMIPSLVRKLELAALVVSVLFLLTAAWQVGAAILSP
jgi:hypothetical protein